MKNKFNKAVRILNVFIAVIFLNSCTESMKGTNNTTYKNGGYTDSKEVHNHTIIDDEQGFCPNCKEGSRFLYKLVNPANQEHKLILTCEECTAIWSNPKKIKWGQTIHPDELKRMFNVDNSQVLFNEKYSGWATKEEAKKSEWNDIVQNSTLLIYSE